MKHSFCLGLFFLSSSLFCEEVTQIMKSPSPYAGLTYKGPVDLDGQPHGKGQMSGTSEVSSGMYQIECGFVHGRCEGFTVFKDTLNKISYVGNIVRDAKTDQYYEHGYGKSVDPRRGTYEGEWKKGRWSGFGLYTDTRGNSYSGEFEMDTPHGMCKVVLTDGTIYFGEWVHGQKHGFGSLTFPNGDRYIGEFFEDLPTGIGGSIAREGGSKIFGEFEKGRMSGIAVEKNPQKAYVRVSEYKEDMVQGLIAEKKMDGALVLYGNLDGKEKSGVIYELKPDGEQYLGEVSDGKYHGRGMLFDHSQVKKIGGFYHGSFQGEK